VFDDDDEDNTAEYRSVVSLAQQVQQAGDA